MNYKKYIPDVAVIIGFVILSFAYFFNPFVEDKVLFQHDTLAGAGASQEIKHHKEVTGEQSRWTNSLFSGMPTYQISPSYDSTNIIKGAEKVYQLGLPSYVVLCFIMLIGFYIMLRAFGVSAWLSGLGAFIWAFSSYFFILIAAGHIWKFITLAYIPPTIAGVVLAYRGRYLMGALLVSLFTALQILSNHIQMSYYFFFPVLFIVLAFFIDAYKNKRIKDFVKATLIVGFSALIGLLVNISSIYHTYQYSKETIRGKSELTQTNKQDKVTSGGLDKDYITQWSYGIGETVTLLVPNAKGGASIPLTESKTAMSKADPKYISVYSQLTQYFGDQPGTSGPVYVGAFVFFLFLLGCFLVKGSLKWALLAATILSVMLAWGKNFMPLTDLFIDYIPLYNKFRAVSSILVIAELTIPLLAILSLKEIIDGVNNGTLSVKYFKKAFYLSSAITFVLIVFAYFGSSLSGSFMSSHELAILPKSIPNEHLAPLMNNITAMRKAIVTEDVVRSAAIILLGMIMLLSFYRGKIRAYVLIIGITLLSVFDLWQVNKRYLNDSLFQEKEIREVAFKKTPSDVEILNDKSGEFRVLNMSVNTFNENNTSYWHKSVGGYHAAKLRRYQELIEHHITSEMGLIGNSLSVQGKPDFSGCNVLNMLNTKYVILPLGKGGTVPVVNDEAFGNAWFVDKVRYVGSADEELASLSSKELSETAFVDAKFKNELRSVEDISSSDTLRYVRLKAQTANTVSYDVSTNEDAVVVFSEIFYPGWTCSIDGKNTPIARANYILRAVYVPAGSKTIEFEFRPNSINTTEIIAYIATSIIILLAVMLIFNFVRRKRQC